MLEDVVKGLEDEVVVINVVADEGELLVDDETVDDVVEDMAKDVVEGEIEDVVDDVVEDVTEDNIEDVEIVEIVVDAAGAALVVDVELEVDEGEPVEELEREVEDAAPKVEDMLDDALNASLLYMFNLNDPPQYSRVLPLQSMVHPVAPGPVVPAARVFPQ